MNLIATAAGERQLRLESLNRTNFKRNRGCEEECQTIRLFEGFVRVTK